MEVFTTIGIMRSSASKYSIQTIASNNNNNNLFTTVPLRLVRDEADEPLHNCAPALSEGEVVILTTQLPHLTCR